jgi:hypothetical protein
MLLALHLRAVLELGARHDELLVYIEPSAL